MGDSARWMGKSGSLSPAPAKQPLFNAQAQLPEQQISPADPWSHSQPAICFLSHGQTADHTIKPPQSAFSLTLCFIQS